MSQHDKSFVETANSDAGQLARERLAWAMHPIGIVLIALFWVLNPGVVDQSNVRQQALIGFLLGAGISLVGNRADVLKHLNTQFDGGVYQNNRVPEEFYWGYKTERLFEKK